LARPFQRPSKPTTLGPYEVVTDDHGTCGNVWATDTVNRTFTVKLNPNGSYRLIRRDRGRFLTHRGRSPGRCERNSGHGRTVLANKTGTMSGFLAGTITGGTFHPNASCPTNCGFTDVWIATFFGAGARFSCELNSRDCRFDFEYDAASRRLRWRHWSDKGTGAGSFLKERFYGDIANT
jgi:hypothetical protein